MSTRLARLCALAVTLTGLAPVAAAQSLAAAVLPSGRSVTVGATATAYASIINTGSATATGCRLSPATQVAATFSYQTTNSATNAPTGSANTPADIPAGGVQSFVFSFTPTAAFAPTDIALTFSCTNAAAAGVVSGVNTLLLSASASPVPDVIATAATTTNDGVAHVPSASGTGFFSTAAINIGAGGSLTIVPVVLGGAQVNAFVCETNPATAACLAAPATSVTSGVSTNETRTYSVFLAGKGSLVAPDFAAKRVKLEFRDGGGAVRGATSVAVCTVGSAGCGPTIPAYHQLPQSVASTTTGHGRTVGVYDWNADGKLDAVVTDAPLATFQLWDGVTPLYPTVLPLAWNSQTGLSLLSATDTTGQPIRIAGGNDAIIARFGSTSAASLLISTTGPEVFSDTAGPSDWVLAKLDLITSTPQGRAVSNVAQAYPNQGHAANFPGTGWGFWHSVAAGDFNGDGWTDLVAINLQVDYKDNNYRYAVPTFMNDRNGGFTYADFLPASVITDFNGGRSYIILPQVWAAGQFGGAGGGDLFWGIGMAPLPSGEWTARSNRIYLNTGSGLSPDFVQLPLPPASDFAGHRYADIAVDRARVADLNKDGLDDILILYLDNLNPGEGWGQIWLQNPDHTFRELNVFPHHLLPNVTCTPCNPAGDIYAVDVNGDGLLDFVLNTGYLASLRDAEQIVWINLGNGTFRTLRELAPNTLPDVRNIATWWFANLEAGPAALIASVQNFSGGIRIESTTLYGFSASP